MYDNTSKSRAARKKAQGVLSEVSYDVQGKKAKAAFAEAQEALRGRSGLSTEDKVANLKTARAALKTVAEHPKNAGTEVAAAAEEARKQLKKALKVHAA